MTIEERFAKFSTEELKAAIERLNTRLVEEQELRETFKAQRNVEFYRMADQSVREISDTLLDVSCALQARA